MSTLPQQLSNDEERVRLSRRSPLEPLRHTQYAACWTTGVLAHAASWMQNLTVPYLVFQLTDSASWLGMAAVAGYAPALIGNPVGGALADRYSRKGILLCTLALKCAVAFILYALWSNDALTLLGMLVLLALNGLGSTIHTACWSAFSPQLVPTDALAATYRINSIMVNLSRAFGPALAGWIIATDGPGSAFRLAGLAYLPFGVALILARPRPVPTEDAENVFRSILAGAQAILGTRRLSIPTITSATVSVFGAGLQGLTAALAAEVYGVGPIGLGWLVSAMGTSCVISGIAIALIGDRFSRSKTLLFGLAAYACGAILAGSTNLFPMGLAAHAIIGIGHVTIYVSCATALQLNLREEFRGRVTSLYMMGIFLGMPLGAQTGGLLADEVGLTNVIISYGFALLLYIALGYRCFDGFRDLDRELKQSEEKVPSGIDTAPISTQT